MPTPVDLDANSLLKAILQSASGSWRDSLEMVDLELGEVLHEPYLIRNHVYFPTTAVVSLLYVLEDGRTAEIAVVGNEGVVGLSLFMGDGITPSSAVVQCAGSALRIDASLVRHEFSNEGKVALLLLRYSQALIAQMSQTAVCNRHHSISQHLCRWILLMLDRHAGNEIVMTQDLIATMLGVRREGVSLAAATLRKDRLIDYSRGRITVLDRPSLERRVCECYAVVKSEYDRLLPALDAMATAAGPRSVRNDAERLALPVLPAGRDTPPEAPADLA